MHKSKVKKSRKNNKITTKSDRAKINFFPPRVDDEITANMMNNNINEPKGAISKIPTNKTVMKTRQKMPKMVKNAKFESENQFNNLSDNESDDSSLSLTQSSNKKRKTASKANAPDLMETETQLNSPKATTKPNAIMVSNIESHEAQGLINHPSLEKKGFFAKRGNQYMLQAASYTDKKKLIELLNLKSYQFHTYTEKEDRLLVFVLKNHFPLGTDELLGKLNTNNIPATKVSLMNQSMENPVYLVYFNKNSISLQQLERDHSIIQSLKISWEKINKRRKKPTQCSRCQLWGHSSTNCGRKRRCIKCLDDHEPGKCLRKPKQDDEPSCVNCKEVGHPSNSPSCKFFKRHVKKISGQQRTNTPRRFNSTPAPWMQRNNNTNDSYVARYESNFPQLPNQSRPSAASTNSSSVNDRLKRNNPTFARPINRNTEPQSAPRNDFFDQFSRLRHELNDIPDMAEAIAIFQALVNDLKAAKSPKDKAYVLFKFSSTQSCF